MDLLNRRIVAGTLALVGFAAMPVIACGTDDAATGTTGGDAGTVIITPDGGAIPASCTDGTKNNDETDTDCGGTCNKCQDGKSCATGADCTDGVCKDTGSGLKCQMPTNTDGVKNGNETGIDCGGMSNPKCADTQPCVMGSDCTSAVCKDSKCAVPGPKDGVQNGDETDVDCGGTSNNVCADTLKCKVDGDCASDVCKDLGDGKGLRCQVPTYVDMKKNGKETDVDCGGDTDPLHACDTGKLCAAGTDCKTLGCNYKKVCAAGRSCTNPGGYGADTCGYGGDGPGQYALDKSWEDCCTKATVTASTGPSAGTPVQLDKYEVTAGRMRVFLEAISYDVRGFVQSARAAGQIPVIPGNTAAQTVLQSDWDMYLPTSFAGNTNADEIADCDQAGATTLTSTTCNPGTEQAGIYTSIKNHLGGRIFKGNNQTLTGCYIGTDSIGGGTHAFRFPTGTAEAPGGTPGVDQTEYDKKGMNCIDYLVGQAFCVWDGGRLELGQEQIAAWGGAPIAGTPPFAAGTMPWSADSALVPVEPTQRYLTGASCTGGNQAAIDLQCDPTGVTKGAYSCTSSQCVLKSGDKTYWGCRFPWATDAAHAQCGLSWPATSSIEWADYKYSYEYPKQDSTLNPYDYIVFISAPGRTRGRGPAGHADVVGNTFALTSNVSGVNADPQLTTHGWSSNGSWEVHNYSKPATGIGPTSNLLNKYGKLGLRCAYASP